MNRPRATDSPGSDGRSPFDYLRAGTISHLLTNYVRVVGDVHFPGLGRARARQSLRQLEAAGFATLRLVVVPGMLSLKTPLLKWQPGDPTPRFDRLAWLVASRWKGPPEKVLIASATAAARRALGGRFGGRPLRRTEVSHDLHVTSLFLNMVRDEPERAEQWVHEDCREASRQIADVVPDAMIEETAIEFGGKYRAEKLRTIHRSHAIAGRAYELW